MESGHPRAQHDFAESPQRAAGDQAVPANGGASRAQQNRKSAIKMQYAAERRRHDLLGQILSAGSFKDRRATAHQGRSTNKKARPTSIVNERENSSSFYQKSKSI